MVEKERQAAEVSSIRMLIPFTTGQGSYFLILSPSIGVLSVVWVSEECKHPAYSGTPRTCLVLWASCPSKLELENPGIAGCSFQSPRTVLSAPQCLPSLLGLGHTHSTLSVSFVLWNAFSRHPHHRHHTPRCTYTGQGHFFLVPFFALGFVVPSCLLESVAVTPFC